LARGWERQVDIGVNRLFYEDDLSAADYRAWLVDNAVDYVALPDTELDDAAVAEGALLSAGVPGLTPMWRDDHWRLWRVDGSKPIVEGPARLEAIDSDSFTVTAY